MKHGEVKRVDGKRVASPEYRAWQLMRNRCLNKNSKDYPYYGAIGIRICKRWDTFENFLADMGRKPTDTLTLDRINVKGNYTPSNCRWATRQTQARNRLYATTKAWELAEQLGVQSTTAHHYIWQIRAKDKGTKAGIWINGELEKVVRTYMKKKGIA